MGVDAAVFRGIQSLESSYGKGLFDVDPATGEAELKAGAPVDVPREAYFAIRTRLGNAAQIEWLRDAVAETPVGGDSLIVRRILFSGTHSGDVIRVDELPRLRDELHALGTVNVQDWHSFLEAVRALIEHAALEKNPIVFV